MPRTDSSAVTSRVSSQSPAQGAGAGLGAIGIVVGELATVATRDALRIWRFTMCYCGSGTCTAGNAGPV